MTRQRAHGAIALGVLAAAVLAAGPKSLEAGGSPSLRVEPDTVRFAPAPVGSLAAATLTLHNDGGADLVLGTLVTDALDFTAGGPSGAPPPGTSIAPGDSLPLQLWFRPSQPDTSRATLTVGSNDPVGPERVVPLVGVALGPPVASVSPASFARTVLTGTTQTDSLVIRNQGEAPLEWQLRILPPAGGAPARASLDGIRILWDRSRGQIGKVAWSLIVGDLEARGAVVQEVSTAITDSLLAGAHAFWTVDTPSAWTPAEGAALGAWVGLGGGILLIGDNSGSVGRFNDLLVHVGSVIRWTPFSASTDVVVSGDHITAHRVTEGVQSIYVGINARELEPVANPALEIVSDTGYAPIVALERIGAGRVMAVSDELFDDPAIGTAAAANADNRLFGNQILDWLAGGRWLSAGTTSGSVASGESTVVELTFDPGDLGTGDYELLVQVTTNDPAAPQFDLPAALTVIGAPGISVDPVAVDFGAVPEQQPASRTLVVTSSGTEVLSVSGIQVSSPVFAASPEVFTLAPGEAESVSVSFNPSALATWAESLTVQSDAAPGFLTVPLSGTGVVDCAAPCAAPSLRPASVEGGHGFAFWLDVALTQAPDGIRSFGFELTWDPAHLSFLDSTLTDGLATGFVVLAQQNEPGRLTCGGFSSNEIPAGSTGSLVKLRFAVDCDTCTVGQTSELRVVRPTEDLAGVRPCCSFLTIASCPAGDGDVNADGILSAQDALCALKIFLNGGSVPADSACDVNGECEAAAADVECDDDVSPGDALAIHERVLCVIDPVPLPCFGQVEPDPCGHGLRAPAGTIRLGDPVPAEDGTVALPLLGEGSVRAFGLELAGPGLELVRIERGEGAADWPALSAAGRAGTVRIGGYGGATRGELARVVVRAAGDIRVTGVFDAVRAGTDRVVVASPRVPAGIAGVHPVPSTGQVTISWGISRAGVAELAVHDVAGRRVRTVHEGPAAPGARDSVWDGRDEAGRRVAAGLYFVVLRAGSETFTRKLVLLR